MASQYFRTRVTSGLPARVSVKLEERGDHYHPVSYSTASGGPGSIDLSAYTHLLRQNQLLEHELSKERQEHTSLKYVP